MSILVDEIVGKHNSDPISFSLSNSFKETKINDEALSNIKIGWLSDMNGNYLYEPEILEICNKKLISLEKNKIKIENLKPKIDVLKLWNCWTTIRAKSIYEDVVDMNIKDINEMTSQAIWEYKKGIKIQEDHIQSELNSRIELSNDLNKVFDNYDFLALPSQQTFPFDKNLKYPEKINNFEMDTYHRWIEVHILASLFYLPSISIPVGFNKNGFPIGIQIIGKQKEDLKLFSFAKKYEEIYEYSKKKPLLN